MSGLPTRQDLIKDANLCVKCAVCLPHCPTFAVRHEETESPRGRIALLQGLASEQLPLTEQARVSLDHCLSCGRCETVCPANVPYTRLMDGARFVMQTSPRRHMRRRRLMARLLSSARALRWVGYLVKVARLTGAWRPLAALPGLGRVFAWMPERMSVRRAPPPQPQSPQAIIFPGCITSAFEQQIVDSAVNIGSRLGIAWHEPTLAVCCGGLYQHLGDYAATRALMTRAMRTFDTEPGIPIATVLSGCGKSLGENLAYAGDPVAAATRDRLIDIHSLLLLQLERSSAQVFAQARAPVAVYLPCSMSDPQQQSLLGLLNTVPAARPVVVGRGYGCCGAAGDHMSTDPASADAMIQPLVREAIDLGISTLVIPNLGCAWHWRANLRRQRVDIEVCHPLQWLNAQLKTPED